VLAAGAEAGEGGAFGPELTGQGADRVAAGGRAGRHVGPALELAAAVPVERDVLRGVVDAMDFAGDARLADEAVNNLGKFGLGTKFGTGNVVRVDVLETVGIAGRGQ